MNEMYVIMEHDIQNNNRQDIPIGLVDNEVDARDIAEKLNNNSENKMYLINSVMLNDSIEVVANERGYEVHKVTFTIDKKMIEVYIPVYYGNGN